jgi:glutathione peroxidase
MKITVLLTFLMSMFSCAKAEQPTNKIMNKVNVFESVSVKDIDGNSVDLTTYNESVLMVINVASFCGYTSQYTDLEKLYQQYKAKGFTILAFPCNDFGKQEPGSNEEIKEFCSTKYATSFPIFDKVTILGDNQATLYKNLTNSDNVNKGPVKWNFEKFIIGKNGVVVGRFSSGVKPLDEEITSLIEKELAK